MDGCKVFPAPILAALKEGEYGQACLRRFEVEGKRMSRQSFAIMKKIRIIHDLVEASPWFAEKVHEVHPEVSFSTMAGGTPTVHTKKRSAGVRERIGILESRYPIQAIYI